jgi:hypothetical protein
MISVLVSKSSCIMMVFSVVLSIDAGVIGKLSLELAGVPGKSILQIDIRGDIWPAVIVEECSSEVK